MSINRDSTSTNTHQDGSQDSTRRILILGMYGWGNLGNECTLEALIANLRLKEPGLHLTAVCPGPKDVRENHGIDAIPFFSGMDDEATNTGSGGLFHKLMWPWRVLTKRIPEEFTGLSQAKSVMQRTDMLIVGGTGILEDNSGWSAGWMWNLFKWLLAAKRTGAAVAFVSIGAGPIHRPLERWVIKRLLRWSEYVSYRDDYSIDYMKSVGLDTASHHRFPDLAFGRPTPAVGKPEGSREKVAVGIMQYVGQRRSREPSESAYRDYVQTLSAFIAKLLSADYDVKIVYGDARYDLDVVSDFRRELRDVNGTGQLTEAAITEVEHVLGELGDCDYVVASRFHNLILSLMLGKPTISVSYHDKNDDLLDAFGLRDYCHDIDAICVDRLMTQFGELVKNSDQIQHQVLATATDLRNEVDRQYVSLLRLAEAHSHRTRRK